tara:strand:+ start:753 stop:1022 length:270 start_codon:yes stop_codon:yes gene_type:complete
MNIFRRLTEEEIITGMQRRALKWKKGKVKCWYCCDEGFRLNPPTRATNDVCNECINTWFDKPKKETKVNTLVKHLVINQRLTKLKEQTQ